MDIIIASRMNSSRLPGKALKKIHDGYSLLDVIVHRIRLSNLAGRIILATSNQSSDDPLEVWAIKNNVSIFRGELSDVLGRISNCAKHFELENFVEILGDNPFVDPVHIDECIKLFLSNKYDYVATSTTEYDFAIEEKCFPIGVRVQCIKSSIIHEASAYIKNTDEREHSSSFLYSKKSKYNRSLVEHKSRNFMDSHKLNLAVNTQGDLDRTVKIVKECGIDAPINMIIQEIYK